MQKEDSKIFYLLLLACFMITDAVAQKENLAKEIQEMLENAKDENIPGQFLKSDTLLLFKAATLSEQHQLESEFF